ncbi:MAG: hypothetical protein ACD_23C00561G0001, partial [uncultured bacterium]
YFNDLNAANALARREWHRTLLVRWITENPPGQGVGWEPYPLSLRIVNWIKWALAGNGLDGVTRHSLAIQARYLVKRLERHLLGNHLFVNAKALVFAGCYMGGVEAEEWLRRGMAILEREIPEQILLDGGQFERSTMYHSLAFEDVLDLINLTRSYPEVFRPWQNFVADWPRLAGVMGRWLVEMCHPDGEISFFNDSVIGIAPAPDALWDYARRLNVAVQPLVHDGVVWLKNSGYIRMQKKEAVGIIDVAPVGPDYLPGHAHADTLSFELSLFGRRVLVNSGIFQYGDGAQRQMQRGTSAHNTVCIDGENSSEVWAGFRVARRARVIIEKMHSGRDDNIVAACHNGYRRLPGKPIHCRTWTIKDNRMEVVDEICGRGSHLIESYLHFHPDVLVRRCRADSVEFLDRQTHSVLATLTCCGEGELELHDGFWYPEFGKAVPNQYCLLRRDNASLPLTFGFRIDWVGSQKTVACRTMGTSP